MAELSWQRSAGPEGVASSGPITYCVLDERVNVFETFIQLWWTRFDLTLVGDLHGDPGQDPGDGNVLEPTRLGGAQQNGP